MLVSFALFLHKIIIIEEKKFSTCSFSLLTLYEHCTFTYLELKSMSGMNWNKPRTKGLLAA